MDKSRNNFSSKESAEKVVEDTLILYFKNGEIPEKGLVLKQVVDNLLLCLNAAQFTSVDELNAAFKSFKVAAKEKEPSLKIVEVINDVLYFRIPDVTTKSEDVKTHLAHYLYFAKIVLMKNDAQCRIVVDKENLGDICPLSVKSKNAMDEIIASAKASTGLVGGRQFTFESGLKGPASTLIPAIRLFNKHSSVFKKMHKKPTNLQMLKDSLNSFFGLKEPGVSEFAKMFLKQTLAIATRPKSLLPSNFSVALKSENKTTSPDGLMAKMGYVRINVDVNKVIKISKLQYNTGDKGEVRSVTVPKEMKDLPHDKAFHAAVKMLLPYVSKKDKHKSMKAQLNNSNTDLSINSREFYLKHSKQVDSFGKAYAFYASHEKNKKKTKPSAVVAAAKKAYNDCVDIPYQNKTGKTSHSYMDLKIVYRRFFENLLGRRESPAKRSISDLSQRTEEHEDTGTPKSSMRKRVKKDIVPEPDDSEIIVADKSVNMEE